MNKTNLSRTNTIASTFLSPELDNIKDLEKYISLIFESLGNSLYESPIRIGVTSDLSYDECIKKSTIPETVTNIEDIISELKFYLQGLIKWNSPGVMINVNPPSLLISSAVTSICSMFNPNLAMDVPSGNLAFAELEVVKMLSDLVGWDYKNSGGIMTFGGKGTVLYAIRVGLHNCCPHIKNNGIVKEKIKVFSTTQGHPCHYETCEWLGIGRKNCVRIDVNSDGTIKLDLLKKQLWRTVKNGEKIACIIVNGGSTLYTTVDDVEKIIKIRNELVQHFRLDYVPHIHVDSVIGWAWLMFDNYDFENNPLEFTDEALIQLKKIYKLIKKIKLADSFGADFHKTGFSPYLCSAFVCKDKSKLHSLSDEKQAPIDELKFGLYAPFSFTLESSRSAISALSAWLSLKHLGKDGYRRIIGTLVECGCDLRNHFANAKYSTCQNKEGHGFAALAMLLPKELRNKSFFNMDELSNEELLRIAKYNHTFYLYMLDLQSKNKIDFALDYVSKHTEIRNIKIGVIKLYPMSPFCNLNYLSQFYEKFEKILSVYDNLWESLDIKDSPYRPKPFVTR